MKTRVFYMECRLNGDNRTYTRVPRTVEYEGGAEGVRERVKREVNIERKGMERDGNPFYERYCEIWGVKEI